MADPVKPNPYRDRPWAEIREFSVDLISEWKSEVDVVTGEGLGAVIEAIEADGSDSGPVQLAWLTSHLRYVMVEMCKASPDAELVMMRLCAVTPKGRGDG